MIRLLRPEERVAAVELHGSVESSGALPPQAEIVGAIDDSGAVVAVLGLDVIRFLGPLVVRRDWRGRQLPAQLADYALRGVPAGERVGIYTVSAHVSRLAESFGAVRMPGEFWMKEMS